MAIGTITKGASSHDFTAGNKQIRIRDIQLTAGANYVTGGTNITPQQAGGLRVINAVIGGEIASNTAGAASVPVAWKIQSNGSVSFFAFVPSTGAEQASNADLSTYTVRATFIGRR